MSVTILNTDGVKPLCTLTRVLQFFIYHSWTYI